MKKIIIISILILLAGFTKAQNAFPRFSTGHNGDNTGRTLSWGYITPLFPSANDSLKITSGYYTEVIQPGQLTAGITVCADTTKHKKPLTNAYAGDEQVFIFNANSHSGGWVVSFGYGYATTGTFTVGQSKSATISFIFDGKLWRETARGVE